MNQKLIKLIKYAATSLTSTVVDLIIFYLTHKTLEKTHVTGAIFIATIIARIFSSALDYYLNRNLVFKSSGNRRKQMTKHFIIAGLQMLMSGSLLTLVDSILRGNEVIEKCGVDLVLFFVAYFGQKHWVYKERSH